MGQAGQAGAVDVHHIHVVSNWQHERYLLAVGREQDACIFIQVLLDTKTFPETLRIVGEGGQVSAIDVDYVQVALAPILEQGPMNW
jgi:hypothetical protein